MRNSDRYRGLRVGLRLWHKLCISCLGGACETASDAVFYGLKVRLQGFTGVRLPKNGVRKCHFK